MPSFDVSSEVNMANLTNSIDVASRMIINRYDFKGTSAKVEFSEKDLTITLYGDSDFQLGQIKDILLPAMEKKEADSSKRIDPQDIQTVSGNKTKQVLKLKSGIDLNLQKKLLNYSKIAVLKFSQLFKVKVFVFPAPKEITCKMLLHSLKKALQTFPFNLEILEIS